MNADEIFSKFTSKHEVVWSKKGGLFCDSIDCHECVLFNKNNNSTGNLCAELETKDIDMIREKYPEYNL